MRKKQPADPASRPGDGIADFESSLEALEQLIDTLERGDLSLDEGLKHFERGIELVRHCQKTLKTAEQKVQVLMEEDPQGDLLDLEPGQSPGALAD